jgi:hypothetical protein
MYLWYSKKKGVNVGNPRRKNTVSELVLCRHDREMSAKSANIRLSGQHVADMLPTFPARPMVRQRLYPAALLLPATSPTSRLLLVACRPTLVLAIAA